MFNNYQKVRLFSKYNPISVNSMATDYRNECKTLIQNKHNQYSLTYINNKV